MIERVYTRLLFLAKLPWSNFNAPAFRIASMSLMKSSALFPVCACVIALAACDTPNYIPDGYVHHNKPYKSQTPPPSPKFSPMQRSTMGPEQADQFRMAVYQLVDNLTNRAGMPPKPVYVVKPEKMTPLYTNIDNDVRESLRHIGYRLSDTPDGAYVIAYTAEVLKDKDGKVVSTSADQGPNVRLGIHVFDSLGENSKMLTKEEGDFYINGADVMDISPAFFDGVFIPDTSRSSDGSGTN